MKARMTRLIVAIALGLMLRGISLLAADAKPAAETKPDYIPRLGEFPPADRGVYLAGELVSVDHVNRRGAIRLDGDFDDGRYHMAPSHRFAMLPYGFLRYHGAPAELRDIPIGTHVHGYFFHALAEDQSIAPPPPGAEKYVPKYTHAISLEDDFSFYQSRGQSWKIVSLELKYDASSKHYPPLHKGGDWRLTPVAGKLKVVLAGPGAGKDAKAEAIFDIDRSTRLWKGRASVELEDLAPENQWQRKDEVASLSGIDEPVQLNLTWTPDWMNHQFQASDLWLDAQSRDTAAEQQRRVHIRFAHTRWLAGWVDHVEHNPGGSGIVTFTLFAGADPSLYDDVLAMSKRGATGALAAGEYTLRTWWQEHDNKSGEVIEVKQLPNPPPGSSGIQVRIKISELLEGFRPNHIIRFRPAGWPIKVKLPPEERIQSVSERERMQMGLDRGNSR